MNSTNFCLNTGGFVSFFLNSDKEASTSGFINFKGWIVELVTGFMMSKGKFESSMCFLNSSHQSKRSIKYKNWTLKNIINCMTWNPSDTCTAVCYEYGF